MSSSFSQTLLDIRRSLGLTQKQLGKSIGVSSSRISTWELGDRVPDPVVEYAVTVKLEGLRRLRRDTALSVLTPSASHP